MKKNKITNKLLNLIETLPEEELMKVYQGYKVLKKTKANYDEFQKALLDAEETQQATRPKEQVNFEGYEIYGKTKPLHKLGGDYYDHFNLDEDRLVLFLADVSGKGIEAASIASSMSMTIDMVLRRAKKKEDVSKMMFNLNNYFYERTPVGKFATMIGGILNRDGFFEYCNAGHEFPLLCSKGITNLVENNLEKTLSLNFEEQNEESGNVLLGMIPNLKYDIFSLKLNRGDVMLLYSDGFSEILEEDSTEKLKEVLTTSYQEEIKEISKKIFDLCPKEIQKDDLTALLVKRL